MKNYMKIGRLLIALILFASCEGYAKSAARPNRNYVKLLLLNEKDEVLLVEYNHVWEPIGGEYNTTLNLEDFVKKLAMTAHAEVKDIRLRGLFSVYYNKAEQPMVYHYYTARYESGDIKPPDDCSGVKWADVNEARRIMIFKEMLQVYEKTLEHDDLLGGTYRITKDSESGTREVEQLVDFYKLN